MQCSLWNWWVSLLSSNTLYQSTVLYRGEGKGCFAPGQKCTGGAKLRCHNFCCTDTAYFISSRGGREDGGRNQLLLMPMILHHRSKAPCPVQEVEACHIQVLNYGTLQTACQLFLTEVIYNAKTWYAIWNLSRSHLHNPCIWSEMCKYFKRKIPSQTFKILHLTMWPPMKYRLAKWHSLTSEKIYFGKSKIYGPFKPFHLFYKFYLGCRKIDKNSK